jgi:hypothetical protein
MNGHAPVAPTTMKPRDCSCGGSCSCDSRCCDLECLVRPNFYCGQLLTDADMTALVDWTRTRLALSRYRDGWGVVCGLHVTCARPGSRAGCCDDDGTIVYVNPGYAVDCCGNDLVVCEPLPVDLSRICRPDDDPCAPGAAAKDSPGKQQAPADDGRGKGCWDRLSEGVFAVDLYLRYHEDLGHGQRPLLGARCGQDTGCEYGRVLERPCVHAELAPLPTTDQTPGDARRQEFKARLQATVKEISDALQRGAAGLRDYLRRHPPTRFCFLDDLYCCLRDLEGTSTKADKQQLQEVRERLQFWLLYDWLVTQLDCECGSCRPDTGVPLARIYLRRSGDVLPVCRVNFIDDSPPYRRLLARDECAPPPIDETDLRRYLYLPRPQAEPILKQHNIATAKRVGEAEAYKHLAEGEYFAAADWSDLRAVFVRDPGGVDRLAAFTKR